MTTVTGNAGTVKIGNKTTGITPAEIKSWSVNQEASLVEDTAHGDTWRTRKVMFKDWSATVECHLDTTDTTGQGVLVVGAAITLGLYDWGTTTGDRYLEGPAIVSKVNRTHPMEGIVAVSFECVGNGALVENTF